MNRRWRWTESANREAIRATPRKLWPQRGAQPAKTRMSGTERRAEALAAQRPKRG